MKSEIKNLDLCRSNILNVLIKVFNNYHQIIKIFSTHRHVQSKIIIQVMSLIKI